LYLTTKKVRKKMCLFFEIFLFLIFFFLFFYKFVSRYRGAFSSSPLSPPVGTSSRAPVYPRPVAAAVVVGAGSKSLRRLLHPASRLTRTMWASRAAASLSSSAASLRTLASSASITPKWRSSASLIPLSTVMTASLVRTSPAWRARQCNTSLASCYKNKKKQMKRFVIQIGQMVKCFLFSHLSLRHFPRHGCNAVAEEGESSVSPSERHDQAFIARWRQR
jgi:hypothetical protein